VLKWNDQHNGRKKRSKNILIARMWAMENTGLSIFLCLRCCSPIDFEQSLITLNVHVITQRPNQALSEHQSICSKTIDLHQSSSNHGMKFQRLTRQLQGIVHKCVGPMQWLRKSRTQLICNSPWSLYDIKPSDQRWTTYPPRNIHILVRASDLSVKGKPILPQISLSTLPQCRLKASAGQWWVGNTPN